jgi:hypothetical protein
LRGFSIDNFSSDPTFKNKVMVVPLNKKKRIVWIEEQFYTACQKEWRKLQRLGSTGKNVYWRVYGEDEAGEGFVSETFGMTPRLNRLRRFTK